MQTPIPAEDFDVIVIGGSYAGQAAALQLARARRRVLVIDAGRRRNRVAQAAHGFLGQDGVSPAVIAGVFLMGLERELGRLERVGQLGLDFGVAALVFVQV